MSGTKDGLQGDLRFWSPLPSMYRPCFLNTVQVFRAHRQTFQHLRGLNGLQAFKKTINVSAVLYLVSPTHKL
jgi:hypothetical protein